MSQIKIIKQDVLYSLKHNLNENNTKELIDELIKKANLNIDIKIENQGYKW